MELATESVPMQEDAGRTVLIEESSIAADCVVQLTLVDPNGADLPAYEPGAHIDVLLPNGLVRQYSLTGIQRDGRWRIGVLREPDSRGGSAWIHDNAQVGRTLHTRGPRNNFPLEESPRYLLIAGGIGVTPLLSMAAELQSRGADWTMIYGGRSRQSMAFLREFDSYGDRVEVWPQDERGLLDLDRILGVPDANTLVYCCGPGALLDAVQARCSTWPSGALRIERFSNPDQPGASSNGSIDVELRRSGVTVTVPPEKSILAALEENGVRTASSCKEGTCGTCETRVLAGDIDHRDVVLSDEERVANDVMMICVSRALTDRIVLDL